MLPATLIGTGSVPSYRAPYRLSASTPGLTLLDRADQSLDSVQRAIVFAIMRWAGPWAGSQAASRGDQGIPAR
jgi:hypothetical protein